MSSPSLSPSNDFFHAALAGPGTVVFGDGSSPRIVIPKGVLSQIFEEVDNGLRLLRRGGVEVGGLLAGPDPQPANLTVDDCLRLQIEYQFGPVFQLSPADFESLEQTVRVIHEPAAFDADGAPEEDGVAEESVPRTVVGFYRMTRGDDEFRDSDREVLETIEQAQPGLSCPQCCLILTPVSKLEVSLRVVFRSGDRLDQSTITIRRDNFQPVAGLAASPTVAAERGIERIPAERMPVELPVAQPKPEIVVRQVEKAGASPAVTRPAVTDVAAPQPDKSAPRRLRTVNPPPAALLYTALGLASLIAIAGGYRWISSMRSPSTAKLGSGTTPQTPSLGFAANPEGPAWKLTWNRDAVNALDPVGATLSIKDGDRERDIALSAADLSSGTLYYSPQGGELAFRLELQRNGRDPVAERVRVLEALNPVGQETAQRPPRQQASSPRQSAPSSAPARERGPATSASVTNPAVPALVPAQANPPQPVAAAPAVPTPPPTVAANVPTPTKEAVASPPINPQPKESAVTSQPEVPAANAQGKNQANAVAKEPPRDTAKSAPPAADVSVLAVPVAPPARPAATTPANSPATQQVNQTPAQQPVAPPVQPAQTAKGPAPSPTVASNSPAVAAPSPAPKQATYQGPRPIKQVPPAAGSTGGTVQVQILVEINAKGKVTKATPTGPIASLPLTVAATKAASYWEFAPAVRDGKAVASEMMLIFKF